MKKKSRGKWGLRGMALFFAALFGTVLVGSGGVLLWHSEWFGVEPLLPAVNPPQLTKPKYEVLFCEIDHNASYVLTLDFETGSHRVRKLYFNNDIYKKTGLSGMKNEAQKLGTDFHATLAVTETQLAALIDYVGGVHCTVNETLSEKLDDISTGEQVLCGISAIKLFAAEKQNEPLCLQLIEEMFLKWCAVLDNRRCFFKLLELSVNDLSYADYLPLEGEFKQFSESSNSTLHTDSLD